MLCVLVAFFALFALAAATSTSKTAYVPKGANCRDYTIPVTVTSENRPWIGPRWKDNYELVDFASTSSARPEAGFPSPVGKPVNQTGSYNIAATFCTPKTPGQHSKTVLLAIHGLGLDKTYWNFPYQPENYNFVQYAVSRGYSVLFYDRVGAGGSSKPSGYDNQISISNAVLSSLIKSVRQGSYITIGKPKYLVLVGHSFGSLSSNEVLAREPGLADAAILTGYAQYGGTSFAARIARLERPRAFAEFDNGYVATVDIFAGLTQFKLGSYDRAAAAVYEETKQPFAIGETLSINPAFLTIDAPGFKGPTLVTTGEYDSIVCGGYCPGVLDQPLRKYFRGSSDYQSYIQPGTGHLTNYAINATGFYGVIFDFLLKHDF